MSQNRSQVNVSFYEQNAGTALRNPLSPFTVNLFMSNFETNLKEENIYGVKRV